MSSKKLTTVLSSIQSLNSSGRVIIVDIAAIKILIFMHETRERRLETCVMADEPKDESYFFIDEAPVEFLHQK